MPGPSGPSELPFDDVFLERLIAGEVSPEELAQLTPEARRRAEALMRGGALNRGLGDVWRRVREIEAPAAGDARRFTEVRLVSARRQTFGLRVPAAIAAAVLVIVGAGVLLRGRWRSAAATSHVTVALVARRGELKRERLPDGTDVVLAPESALEFDSVGFGRTQRDVALVGQASFAVVHQPAHPFRVRAGGAVTEDIATRFVVRAYAGAPTRVAVAEGSVSVRHATGTVLAAGAPAVALAAGQAATLAGADASMRADVVDTAVDFGWESGSLTFHNAPLGEIAAQFTRRYNVELTITDNALRSQRLTVGFLTETPDEACHMIALLAQARCRSDDGRLRLIPRL